MNRHLTARSLGPCFAFFALFGCDSPIEGQQSAAPPETASSSVTLAAALVAQEGERMLLHADRVGEVWGQLVPSVPFGDALRTIVLHDDLEQFGVESGTLVLDVRLTPQGAVVLHADHTLRLHATDGERQLDVGVDPPISVAARQVTYVAGNSPMLQLRRVSLDGGEPESLAPDIVTAWSPVMSADGREVIFSASVDGWSKLMRRDAEGTLHRLEGRRVPSASVAPHWRGRHLIFQDEHGVAVHDLESGTVVADYPRAHLLPDYRGDEPWVRVEGSSERVNLEVPQ